MPVSEARLSTVISVGTGNTVILAANPGRQELTIVAQGTGPFAGADPIFLEFQTVPNVAPTAVVGEGVMINRGGGSYTTNNFKGAIAGITTTGACNVSVLEL